MIEMKQQKHPNIVFVIIDALRTRNLSCYGYSKPTSPNIDMLAREGVLFEDAYSCTNITDASLTTIFSGRHPLSHGVLLHGERVKEDCIERLNLSGIRFLPEILRSNGYTTFAVDWLGRWHKRGYDYYSGMSTSPGVPLIKEFLHERLRSLLHESLLRLGFLRFPSSLRKILFGESAAVDLTDEAVSLIKSAPVQPFFLFVHYWDTHFPYHAPADYVKEYRGNLHNQNIQEILDRIDPISTSYTRIGKYLKVDSVDEVIARYDGAIAYVDHEIGRILETLDECGVSDDTIFILTSDHGESLTEHGIFFEHHGLYDVSIHVPLIISYSESPKGKRTRGFIQHFDIVPTILDILGIETQNFDFDGKSALPLISGETEQMHPAIYAEEAYWQRKRAVRTYDNKYIAALSEKGAVCRACKCVHGGIEELYDLNEDPEETQNMVEEDPRVANTMKRQLSKWVRSLEHKKKKERIRKEMKELSETTYSQEEKEKVMERLRSLGYL